MITKLDNKRIDELVAQELITKRKHPKFDIWILNYAPKTQIDKVWTEETLMCRGLVVDAEGIIIARPFKKFFNYGENVPHPHPNETFEVFDKKDGSLGIVFNYKGHWIATSRGSFESEHSKWAQDKLYSYDLSKLNPRITYLFEMIIGWDRIVVDYGKDDELVLLGAILTNTGSEIARHAYPEIGIGENGFNCKVVEMLDFTTLESVIEHIKKDEVRNKEGFVVNFPYAQIRLKFKYPHYMLLHKTKYQLTKKNIWEACKTGRVDEMLKLIPDEFYSEFKNISILFYEQYKAILKEAKMEMKAVKKELAVNKILTPTRKEIAAIISKKKYRAILFYMLDGKKYDDMIWDLIEPHGDQLRIVN